jgi:hypothetical protein
VRRKINMRKILTKFRYGIFIPRKITKRPNKIDSVISDLFPVRTNDMWTTFFESINVPGLINGDNSEAAISEAAFFFFDNKGKKIGNVVSKVGVTSRQTIKLDQDFFPEIEKASTFAVFHQNFNLDVPLSGSYLAERGYIGIQRKDVDFRGYVHGNLDAIAYSEGKLKLLGNSGIIPRIYQVQHPLRGKAKYDFILTNPTTRNQKIKFQYKSDANAWETIQRAKIQPRGSHTFEIELNEGEVGLVRLKSHLYLARPVVIRQDRVAFDIFHG